MADEWADMSAWSDDQHRSVQSNVANYRELSGSFMTSNNVICTINTEWHQGKWNILSAERKKQNCIRHISMKGPRQRIDIVLMLTKTTAEKTSATCYHATSNVQQAINTETPHVLPCHMQHPLPVWCAVAMATQLIGPTLVTLVFLVICILCYTHKMHQYIMTVYMDYVTSGFS